MGGVTLTTLALLVDDCYSILYGIGQAERPAEDLINGALAQGATTVTMDTDGLWKRNDYAEFATDGEIIVFAADASGSTAIRRAQRGTTDVAQADNSLVYRNPTFPRFEIERLINQVVRNDLYPNVWSWHQDSLTFTTADFMYPLDQFIEDVSTMYQADLNSDNRFYPFRPSWWSVENQIDSTFASNGGLLRIRHVWDESATVYYTAKRRPDPDDLGNMSNEVAELVPWAVAGKLEGQRSVATRHRPHTDNADRIEGGPFRDYRGFMGEFIRMRKDLRVRLDKEVPTAPRYLPRHRRRAF